MSRVFLKNLKNYPTTLSISLSPRKEITNLCGRHTICSPLLQNPCFTQYWSGQLASVTAIFPSLTVTILYPPSAASKTSCCGWRKSTVTTASSLRICALMAGVSSVGRRINDRHSTKIATMIAIQYLFFNGITPQSFCPDSC